MTGIHGPVGVFDSGVGGLTVVAALRRRFPAAGVLYVADQAHVPYGGRPLDEVRAFALGISAFLAAEGCSAVVMACNISSAVALDVARGILAPLPVLGVIAPAARRAAALGAARVGVLATQGTVCSGAYPAQVALHSPSTCVTQVACPRFVPLAEAGETGTPEAVEAARVYLAPLAEARCGAVILGCTHYPYLLPALRSAAAAMDYAPEFIDPAHEMADAVSAAVSDLEAAPGPVTLLSTADPRVLARQAERLLPGVGCEAGAARWRAGDLERA